MTRATTVMLLSTLVAGSGLLLATCGKTPTAYQALGPVSRVSASSAAMCPKPKVPEKDQFAYHKEPPTGPLPATLDPEPFKDQKSVYVGYSIASKIPGLLYQEPCLCPCDKLAHHESLLDCFTSGHGEHCPVCRSQVFFIYEQHKKGKTASEIRNAIEKGDAWEVDANKYAEAHYAEHTQTEQ